MITCRYWELKKLQNAQASRRLGAVDQMFNMGEWILSDPTATNMAECTEYVATALSTPEGLFAHNSEHASFQILTPTGTIRLSHGRLHQVAMRDPTDQFDLPEHLTWQMNVAVDHHDVSLEATGVLGETVVPTVDASGKPIMHGLKAIRGSQDECEWSLCCLFRFRFRREPATCNLMRRILHSKQWFRRTRHSKHCPPLSPSLLADRVEGPLGTIFTQGNHHA